MKLKEYLDNMEPGSELTCWDTVIDTEFYFYSKDEDWEPDEDPVYRVVDECTEKMAAMLDVVEVREDGVVVNLYDMLEHPKVIEFAKEYFYEPHQYGDDDDIVMMLFDDNDSNFSNGYVEFSRMMIQCLEQAYGTAGEKYQIAQIKELEKELDGPEHVRAGIAEMGIRLDKLVSDESWLVRSKVAEHGYGLDVLVNDQHWAVRKAVAKQGYALDVLLNDKDERVVQAARDCLKKQAFEEEMNGQMLMRREEDGIDAVLKDAQGRSTAGAPGEGKHQEHLMGD